MKAVVWTEYGPPEILQIEEVAKPVPADHEVLIRISATTVIPGDCVARSGAFPPLFWLPMRLLRGLRKPRNTIPGSELAGEVEAVGKDVTLYRKGDQIFGEAGLGLGSYAQYICLPEKGLMTFKPANITFEEAAAAVDGPITALHFLRKGNIKSGTKVLINGASGSIGTFAVQLAKYFGAEVTGVCSTANLELVKSLGADKVIDYTEEDFTTSGETYDAILDTVGKTTFSRCKRSLKKNGFYLTPVPTLTILLQMLWTSRIGGKKVISGMPSPSTMPDDLKFLKELMEAENLKSVIDRRYPLEQIAEAHRYVETGHKKGNVVIIVEHNNKT
ncbi:MAG: NAD(P)-dependent alcohol dehydrogenase [Fidelibacterota bacterium]|nr:MAG: NAD(P)-dependent alcohol dehydrogenase [Candidatus Neomarinimicrobiota bacterium]